MKNRETVFMNDEAAEGVIKRLESLAEKRAPWEPLWHELAEYVLPREAGFITSFGGPKKTGRVFDSTAPLALERFAAALESVLTPRSQRWHSLKTGLAEIDEDPDVSRYLATTTDILFKKRYQPESNFANQISEAYLSLGVFGTAVMFVGERQGGGFIYRSHHLSEFYFGEDQHGRIDTVMRVYKLTAVQAAREFGLENLPPEIVRCAEEPRQMDRAFDFVHAVMPNPYLDHRRADARGMAYASWHLAKNSRTLVRSGGYRVLPYAVSRYQTSPGEIYGRSPALTALADIKQVNEMEKTLIRAGQKAVDPPLLLADDDVLSAFSLKAGALNYGGLSDDGRQRVVPLETSANFTVGRELLEQKRRVINDAFLVTLFQILVDAPQMTATEVMRRAQEKADLLGPAIGRQQSELLAPIINRELDILMAGGFLPHLPDKLVQAGPLAIQYESPISRAQRSEEGLAILGAVQALEPLARLNPKVLEIFNLPEAARLVARVGGVPPKVLFSREELSEKSEQAANKESIAPSAAVSSADVSGRGFDDILKKVGDFLNGFINQQNSGQP